MSLRVSFAEQATGIVTKPSGEWALGGGSFQKAEGFHEAVTIVREYLERHPSHEAWVGSTVTSHRITPPVGPGFGAWIERYEDDGGTEAIRLGMTFGEVISVLGWPDDCSLPMGKSPLSVILRYQPGDVDFHFDQGGRLMLVHRDDLDDPVTILIES